MCNLSKTKIRQIIFRLVSVVVIFVFAQSSTPTMAIDNSNLRPNPDPAVYISAVPSNPIYKKQWYLERIFATTAWNYIQSSPSVTIAVIDSGIQVEHPDLRDNIWINRSEIPDNKIDDDANGYVDDYNGWDFVDNSSDPSPKFHLGFTESGVTHGTVIAGVIAANGANNIGVAGVTWNARIMPLRVLNDRGEGRMSDVVRAIDYAVANNANIINLSFVGFEYNQSLQDAIRRAYRAGVIIVAAAGNEEGESGGYDTAKTPIYPACMDGDEGENMVIGVAATDAVDQKAEFSSFGFQCVDISAPGISIYSTTVYDPRHQINYQPFDKYYDGYWSGTSMAAAMVSGAIALIEESSPSASRAEVIRILLSNTDNISRLNPNYLGQLGRGRLNVQRSVVEALNMKLASFDEIITAPMSATSSIVNIRDRNGESRKEFSVYEANFQGGVRLATGDVNGDRVDEIITGAGVGGGPHVRIFDQQGQMMSQFFAFDKNSRGGVYVATGDLNGDGIDEIITGAGEGELPYVKIYNIYGYLKAEFLVYSKNFRGGVNVASGDINGDGIDEIITGAGDGGGPHVRIFDMSGKVLGQFFAYDKNIRSGVRVTVADLDGRIGRNQAEIICAPGEGQISEIRIFDGGGRLKKSFQAYHTKFRGGVNISTGDIDGDGLPEIITGAGPGGRAHIRIFEQDSSLLESFYVYGEEFKGGINVAPIKIKR